MAVRPILIHPEPVLRDVAAPRAQFDADLATLVADMAETMYRAPGIGLAAPQVGLSERVVVVDVSEDRSGLLTLINPIVVESHGESEYEEGCLSLPHVFAAVKRPAEILVRAQNIHGEDFEFEADGLLSTCVQHEIDHLDGKLFIDYLSRLRRERLLKAMRRALDAERLEASKPATADE